MLGIRSVGSGMALPRRPRDRAYVAQECLYDSLLWSVPQCLYKLLCGYGYAMGMLYSESVALV